MRQGVQGEQCWEWFFPEAATVLSHGCSTELEGRLENQASKPSQGWGRQHRTGTNTNYHANVTACKVSYTWLSTHTPLPLPGRNWGCCDTSAPEGMLNSSFSHAMGWAGWDIPTAHSLGLVNPGAPTAQGSCSQQH